MRVMIMSDMEGVSGIVAWEQVNGGAAMYEEGRRLYTEEINAAVRGAKAAGATEIVAVKEGPSRYSARQIPPVRARQMIEDGAREALKDPGRVRPYDPGRPLAIRIDLATPDRSEKWRRREGVEIPDPRTVIARGDDF